MRCSKLRETLLAVLTCLRGRWLMEVENAARRCARRKRPSQEVCDVGSRAQVRRLMEADNAARRSARRKEYNQTVRELAAFARKRDKRVAAWQAMQAQQRLDRETAEQQRCV